MTDQVQDSIVYEAKGYSLAEAKPGIFSPWDYGIEPEDVCTSNWAGYIAHFQVLDKQLQLSSLEVGYTAPTRRDLAIAAKDPLAEFLGTKAPLPLLNGVSATNAGGGYWQYDSVGLSLNYSGILTLSPSNVDDSHYLELKFENGQLINTTDRPKPKDII